MCVWAGGGGVASPGTHLHSMPSLHALMRLSMHPSVSPCTHLSLHTPIRPVAVIPSACLRLPAICLPACRRIQQLRVRTPTRERSPETSFLDFWITPSACLSFCTATVPMRLARQPPEAAASSPRTHMRASARARAPKSTHACMRADARKAAGQEGQGARITAQEASSCSLPAHTAQPARVSAGSGTHGARAASPRRAPAPRTHSPRKRGGRQAPHGARTGKRAAGTKALGPAVRSPRADAARRARARAVPRAAGSLPSEDAASLGSASAKSTATSTARVVLGLNRAAG